CARDYTTGWGFDYW
nr:immunoglobulin heavy chain junction region [Macaca mulatta]MOV37929.1 immunoglobulin heavy chain junction region [Macaca mulatta]MOV38008.1 immunoglobulin heavy chain junction region [Macaca mulatta]MOV38019.1 immunoglobulin heavy chain junction region [Macaca mulatta]MOV38387.1 immunoglobulin heavy chain junction region [Macaca mulatta]